VTFPEVETSKASATSQIRLKRQLAEQAIANQDRVATTA